jgi:MSHA pilin protein MshD
MPNLLPTVSTIASAAPPRAGRRAARGLSLIELLIFIAVVSLALAGVLQVFLQSISRSADPMLRRQELAIAESMLEEVSLMPFTFCQSSDPNVATATSTAGCSLAPDGIGPEAGENRFVTPQFDNVNDYNGYAMNSGIVDITNTAVPGLSAYTASVTVANATLNSISSSSGDALLITVKVTGPNGSSVTLQGYRARYAPNSSI